MSGAVGIGVVLSLLGLTGCYPAEHPELEGLPSCFAQGVPLPRVGMAKVRLRWVHQPDDAFRPQAADVSLDGQRVYESRSTEQLQRELVTLADVDVAPGRHRLDSLVRVSGWGLGPFAYLKGYRFDVPKQHAFTLEQGSVRCLSLVAYYNDGLTLPLEARPATVVVEERPKGPGGLQ